MTEKAKCLRALGLRDGASDEEIKRAYKRLALQFHPDKNTGEDAKEKFQEIAYAYKFLTEGPSAFPSDSSREDILRQMFEEMFFARYMRHRFGFPMFFGGDCDEEFYFDDSDDDDEGSPGGRFHCPPRREDRRDDKPQPTYAPPPMYREPSKKQMRKKERRHKQRVRIKEKKRLGKGGKEKLPPDFQPGKSQPYRERQKTSTQADDKTEDMSSNPKSEGCVPPQAKKATSEEKPASRSDTPVQGQPNKMTKRQKKKLESEQRKREQEMKEIAEELHRKHEREKEKKEERERQAAKQRRDDKENIDISACFDFRKKSKRARQRERKMQEAESRASVSETPTSQSNMPRVDTPLTDITGNNACSDTESKGSYSSIKGTASTYSTERKGSNSGKKHSAPGYCTESMGSNYSMKNTAYGSSATNNADGGNSPGGYIPTTGFYEIKKPLATRNKFNCLDDIEDDGNSSYKKDAKMPDLPSFNQYSQPPNFQSNSGVTGLNTIPEPDKQYQSAYVYSVPQVPQANNSFDSGHSTFSSTGNYGHNVNNASADNKFNTQCSTPPSKGRKVPSTPQTQTDKLFSATQNEKLCCGKQFNGLQNKDNEVFSASTRNANQSAFKQFGHINGIVIDNIKRDSFDKTQATPHVSVNDWSRSVEVEGENEVYDRADCSNDNDDGIDGEEDIDVKIDQQHTTFHQRKYHNNSDYEDRRNQPYQNANPYHSNFKNYTNRPSGSYMGHGFGPHYPQPGTFRGPPPPGHMSTQNPGGMARDQRLNNPTVGNQPRFTFAKGGYPVPKYPGYEERSCYPPPPPGCRPPGFVTNPRGSSPPGQHAHKEESRNLPHTDLHSNTNNVEDRKASFNINSSYSRSTHLYSNETDSVKYAKGGTLNEIEEVLRNTSCNDRSNPKATHTAHTIETGVNSHNQSIGSLDSLDDFMCDGLPARSDGFGGFAQNQTSNGMGRDGFSLQSELGVPAGMFTDSMKNYYKR
ncbi:uncharacterized protein LOC128208913 isoform X1 [Mya arenaria]|uniref:uncharacterized protein LOC128208913 isoform X1 n=1 Tax=Mya arenaria TaxID=6604 RepID=UPI0022E14B18|nr:uncharacterized protein LOC128208913 isoform X1 [Mya arenaria]XP_052768581.1 uncharacterized protein LOC128208913 isoform X1 [Mya arenaria]XP_052768582.1 uncharacterized protein LOC128208913 isoform X1 [Mya arenaria]